MLDRTTVWHQCVTVIFIKCDLLPFKEIVFFFPSQHLYSSVTSSSKWTDRIRGQYIKIYKCTFVNWIIAFFLLKVFSNSLWPSDQSVSHTWTHSKVTAVFHRKHSDMNLDTAATFCESNSIQLCERKKSDIPFQLILSYIIIICHLRKGLYKNDFGKLKLRSETSSEQHIC